MDRRAEGVEIIETDRRWQMLYRHRVHGWRQHRALRQQFLQVILQHMGKDRAE